VSSSMRKPLNGMAARRSRVMHTPQMDVMSPTAQRKAGATRKPGEYDRLPPDVTFAMKSGARSTGPLSGTATQDSIGKDIAGAATPTSVRIPSFTTDWEPKAAGTGLVFAPPRGRQWYSAIQFTDDGRYVLVNVGTAAGNGSFWRDRNEPDSVLRPLFALRKASMTSLQMMARSSTCRPRTVHREGA